MVRIIGSPSCYIQGKGELKNLVKRSVVLGDSLVFIVEKKIQHLVMFDILFEVGDVRYQIIEFEGECCFSSIQNIVKDITGNVIIGIGGGKVLDVAKAVAYFADLPIVLVPTVASSDAPCSAISVLYTEDGLLDRYLYLLVNPNMIIVDTEVICKAPVRFLVAGMGDALSTYFEARMCYKSGVDVSKAALSLAKACYQTLMEDGVRAYLDIRNKQCTDAVENIIEANIYLSGIGFESGGLALAHAINNGLSQIPKINGLLHGEKVAFGTLVQLIYEKASEFEEVIAFCKKVGLPTTLKEVGVFDKKQLMDLAKFACDEVNEKLPISVEIQDVYEALLHMDLEK